MVGKFLLDTNIIIELLNGNSKISALIEKMSDIFISAIVIGELYYGAFNSSHKKRNLKKLEEFIIVSSIIEINTETSKYYGEIKVELKKIGKPIPENDLWIAAIANQYNLTLITKDKHFKNVKSLKVKIV